jgi:hypothetical protein
MYALQRACNEITVIRNFLFIFYFLFIYFLKYLNIMIHFFHKNLFIKINEIKRIRDINGLNIDDNII